MSALDELWNEVMGDAAAALDWMKQVVLGEFDDHQSTSALIAQMIASFVPGVIIVMSARDMTAVVIRMVRHPEKRESLTEWMILSACALGLVPALVGAAVGAVGAGVGAVVGGLVGDEAGAALRATALLLIEDGTRILEQIVLKLRRFVKGDILRFLRAAKFAEYGKPAAEELAKFIGHLRSITLKVMERASHFTWINRVGAIVEKLRVLERSFYELQHLALKNVPRVMEQFDIRLQHALGDHLGQGDHVVHYNKPAPHPTPKPPEPRRVAARTDHPLGTPPGTEHPGQMPPKVEPEENLHPQGADVEPKRMEEEKLPCFKGKNLSPAESAELDRQLAGQQAGLNKMTVQEYLDGRADYAANGRGSGSVATQARADHQATLQAQMENDNIAAGMDDEAAAAKAETDAAAAMKSLAALHNPDQVAGGANVIDDFGDSRMNSTIGGQWATNVKGMGQSRVSMLDAAANNVPEAERSTTLMNASLEQCK